MHSSARNAIEEGGMSESTWGMTNLVFYWIGEDLENEYIYLHYPILKPSKQRGKWNTNKPDR